MNRKNLPYAENHVITFKNLAKLQFYYFSIQILLFK